MKLKFWPLAHYPNYAEETQFLILKVYLLHCVEI